MSSVGTIGALDPSLLMQQLQGAKTSAQKAPPTVGGAAAAPDADDGIKNAFATAAEKAGLDTSKLPALRSQMDAAMKQVREKDANDPTQMRADMQAAADNVLKQNGVDPAAFKADMQAITKQMGGVKGHGRHHGHHHKQDGDVNGATGASGASGIGAGANSVLAIPTPDNGVDVSTALQGLPAGALVDEQG
jgi:hypothetical protein